MPVVSTMNGMICSTVALGNERVVGSPMSTRRPVASRTLDLGWAGLPLPLPVVGVGPGTGVVGWASAGRISIGWAGAGCAGAEEGAG